MIRRLSTLLVLAAALAAGGAFAAPAQAADPCWKRLVIDWSDGRIDGAYPVWCYREAIRKLPEDLRGYSEAQRDIQRALYGALRSAEGSGNELGEDDPVMPLPEDEEPGPRGEGSPEDPDDPMAIPSGGGPDEGGGGLIGVLGSTNADALPLPLIVLGGLAGLLLSAGSASFVARRIHARRVPVSALRRDADVP